MLSSYKQGNTGVLLGTGRWARFLVEVLHDPNMTSQTLNYLGLGSGPCHNNTFHIITQLTQFLHKRDTKKN